MIWSPGWVPFSEASPLLLGVLLGILFGAQFRGEVNSRSVATILLLGLAAAFVLGTFPYFTTIEGGSFESLMPGSVISFANSYVGGVIGLLIGKLASRRA